ncbi:MAG: alpha/beta hydrolase [bacterium]|nr:alpha/beta hydrolase [bacterium]
MICDTQEPNESLILPTHASLRLFEQSLKIRQVEHQGRIYSYEMSGEGDSVVLLLGGGFNFRPLRLFQALARDFRVVAPRYPAGADIDKLVGAFDHILIREARTAVKVVGPSLGGALAQCLLRAYPDRVQAMVLSNTSTPIPLAGWAFRLVRPILALAPYRPLIAAIKPQFVRMFSPTWKHRGEVREWIDEHFRHSFGRADLLSLVRLAADYHGTRRFLPGDLEGWKGEVLIIESSEDTTIPARYRDALKLLYPRATVHTFQSDVHSPSITQWDQFISVIRGFLL